MPAERFYQKMQGPAPKGRSGWATQERRGKGRARAQGQKAGTGQS